MEGSEFNEGERGRSFVERESLKRFDEEKVREVLVGKRLKYKLKLKKLQN